MLPEYKTKTNVAVGVAIVLKVFGLSLMRGFGADRTLGALLFWIGEAALIYGCCCYARGKGHNAAWGALGLLSLFGLLSLVLMPDRHKDAKVEPIRRRRRRAGSEGGGTTSTPTRTKKRWQK